MSANRPTGNAGASWSGTSRAIFSGTAGMVNVAEAVNVGEIRFLTDGYKLNGVSKEDFQREKAPSFGRDEQPNWSADYDRKIRGYYHSKDEEALARLKTDAASLVHDQ